MSLREKVAKLGDALEECLWLAETEGTSLGTEFPILDIIEVCRRALYGEEEDE